jgi:glycosyltransferase involved in cell wall biosynthesis
MECMTSSASQPLISFVLVAFRQERYIRDAVASALAQTYSPLEIILSDDCSPDGTFAIMKEVATAYGGKHKVLLNRNTTNLGLAGNVNAALNMASGEIIVIAAGDDVSKPERTEILAQLYRKGGAKIAAAFSNAVIMDDAGTELAPWFPENWTPFFHESPFVISCSHTPMVLGATNSFRREVWSQFSHLENEIQQEDVILALRARLQGEIAYTPECLVKYRRHDANLYNPETATITLSEDRHVKNRLALERQMQKDLAIAYRGGNISALGYQYYRFSLAHMKAMHWLNGFTGDLARILVYPALFVAKVIRYADRRVEVLLKWIRFRAPQMR